MGSAMIARTVPDAWLDAQRRGRGRMIGNADFAPCNDCSNSHACKNG
jgi:hypothetical protein